MARHFGREDDLILLQVRPDDAPLHWQPKHTYNLTSDRTIPYNTFAKAVVDTAGSLGQAGDKGFFKNQAQIHIAAALETLREIGADVTLENVYHLLLDQGDLDEAMTDLASSHQTPRRRELSEHFTNRFLSQPSEQIGGVKETIANYLQAFITPDIAQVFCPAANTFDFADIDRGKIICVAMPQKFQLERRYVNTFLKMLFYTHALRRFDKPAEERRRDNLLILWADEAQRFVTASEDGMSDYNCIDVIREAQATVVAAAQSSTSSFRRSAARKRASSPSICAIASSSKPPTKKGQRKRRLPRQEEDHQKIMGLLRRKEVEQLQRARRAQNQAARAAQFPETHRGRDPLRARLSEEMSAAAGAERQNVCVVSVKLRSCLFGLRAGPRIDIPASSLIPSATDEAVGSHTISASACALRHPAFRR